MTPFRTSDNLTIAYLAIGAVKAIQALPTIPSDLLDGVEGELGLIDSIVDFAHAIDEQFAQLQTLTDDAFVGVHCYDIAGPTGEWIIGQMLETKDLPTTEQVLLHTRHLYFQNCTEDVLDTAMGSRIILRSNHANLLVDRATGTIIENRQLPDSEDSFEDIVAFDPRDLAKAVGDEMDILDAGFWDRAGGYTPARAEVGPPDEYLVAWEINADGHTPMQAAMDAMTYMRRAVLTGMGATFLAVTDANGDTTKIDWATGKEIE